MEFLHARKASTLLTETSPHSLYFTFIIASGEGQNIKRQRVIAKYISGLRSAGKVITSGKF